MKAVVALAGSQPVEEVHIGRKFGVPADRRGARLRAVVSQPADEGVAVRP